MAEKEESPAEQTQEHVEEAVPSSDITTTAADIPPDYGEPGVADFSDAAWDEVAEDDPDERPSPGEPDEEDENADEEIQEPEEDEEDEEEPLVPPGILEEDEMPDPEQ